MYKKNTPTLVTNFWAISPLVTMVIGMLPFPDDKSVVAFATAKHHHPLASTILY